jgi:transcriptional regulator with XRE-family HTH domain
MDIRHMPLSPQAIVVKRARIKLQMTQPEFSKILGKDQSIISRYEKGAVEPPSEVIMHCMHIISGKAVDFNEIAPTAPSVEDLIHLIKNKLRGEKMADVRKAIVTLLEKV